MGGAVTMSSVGLFYPILDSEEPDVTIVRYLDNFHICQRKWSEPGLKEIIADTRDHVLARLIAAEVQRFLDTKSVHELRTVGAPVPSPRLTHLQQSIRKSHRRIEAGPRRRKRQ